jgi:hypothetical protein
VFKTLNGLGVSRTVAASSALITVVFCWAIFGKPEYKIDALASVIGLAISILGFYVTILALQSARTASEQARDAAIQTKTGLERYEVVRSGSEIISALEELNRLALARDWPIARERCVLVRKGIQALKGSGLALVDDEAKKLSAAAGQIAIIEQMISSAMLESLPTSRIPRLLAIVSEQSDTIITVISAVRNRL